MSKERVIRLLAPYLLNEVESLWLSQNGDQQLKPVNNNGHLRGLISELRHDFEQCFPWVLMHAHILIQGTLTRE